MDATFTPGQALIIGGTRGIGRALAARLAARDVDVTIVGRSHSGEDIARTIGARFFRADVGEPHDLGSLVDHVRSKLPSLDLLVHSADVLTSTRSETSDGLDQGFAVNYRSRVWLDEGLADLLSTNAPSRIVHVAAAGFPGRLDLDSVPPGPDLSVMAAHSIGQRANDVYAVDLAERLAPRGVTVLVTNPGMVDTDIRDASTDSPLLRIGMRVMETIASPFMPDAETYAERLDELATRPLDELEGGPLYGPRFRPVRNRSHVSDPERRARLLARSLELIESTTVEGGAR